MGAYESKKSARKMLSCTKNAPPKCCTYQQKNKEMETLGHETKKRREQQKRSEGTRKLTCVLLIPLL